MRVQTLARYHEGAISGRRAARIAQHLAACHACAAASEQLTGIGALLASVEMPPMPARLADRIELALQAECAARSPGEGVAGVPGRPDLPERSTRKPWRLSAPDLTSPRLLRGLAAATGAALLVAGASYVLVSANTSPPPVAAHQSMRQARGGIAAPLSTRAAAPAGPRQLSYTRHGKSYTYTALALKENFTPAELGGQVRAHLPADYTTLVPAVPSTAEPTASGVPGKATQGSTQIGGITISQLGGCLSRIAAGRQVLLAMVARYQGVPATIVVIRPTGGGSFLDVIVVKLACSASDADIITKTTTPSG